jgi:hypothetical protein
VYPIEDNYTEADLKLSWGNLQDDLDALTYSGLAGAFGRPSFTITDLRDVQKQLDKEFTDVSAIWGFIDNLKQPYANEAPEDTLSTIAYQIRQSLPQPQNPSMSYDPLAISEEVLYVVGAVAAATGQEEVPFALELLAAGWDSLTTRR